MSKRLTPPQQPDHLSLSASAHTVLPFALDEVEDTVPSRFHSIVSKFPDHTAVRQSPTLLSYAQLNASANKIAHAILDLLGNGEEPVAILLDHGIPSITALLAVLKTDKFFVPLDPSFPKDRNAFILNSIQTRLLLTNQQNLPAARQMAAAGAHILNIDALPRGLPESDPEIRLTPDHLALVYFTSGSTGTPKGVPHTHRNILHRAFTYVHTTQLTKNDIQSHLSSYSFSASRPDIFGPLLNGTTLSPFFFKHASLSHLQEWLISEGITLFNPPVMLFRQFLQSLPEAPNFPKLRLIALSGQKVRPEDVAAFKQRINPNCSLAIQLASTEASSYTQFKFNHDDTLRDNKVPVGYALPGLSILILDKNNNPLEFNQIGQIAVQGHFLSTGYWNDPELTAQKFIHSPGKPENTIFLTGDQGSLHPDGWLDFMGRNDNQVKVRGYRVELSEIESALIKHPEIDQAIVSSLPGTSGETRLVAYMNAASHPPPTITSLRAFLMDSLPDYMLPSKYIWVTDFPKTPTGKIDLRSLPSPDSSRPVLGDDYTPPNTPTEERLASIWSEILNITPVGIHDNYFDLGGNSIQAALIFSRLERIYAKRLPITSLLQAPTVHLLAAVLERAGTTNDWHTVAPLQTGGNKPPLFCLAPRDGGVMVYYDLIKLLGPDQPGYGLLARGLDGHEVPFDRIEDMAAHYIAEIRAIQPVGPYYLVGYSSGGVVAYEMAHQLNDLNQEVALLVMLDAYGVGYPKLLPNTTRWTKDYYRRVERLKGHFFNLSSMNPKEKLDYLNSRAKDRLLNSKNVWVGRWRELFDPVFRRAMKVRQANYQARYHYHPKPYPGKVLLVRASRQHKGIYPDPMLGWGELLTGDFEVFESPGDHYAIMYPPGLLPVADKIRSSLAASQT